MFNVVATRTVLTNADAIDEAKAPMPPQVLFSAETIQDCIDYLNRDILMDRNTIDYTASMRGPAIRHRQWTFWIVATGQRNFRIPLTGQKPAELPNVPIPKPDDPARTALQIFAQETPRRPKTRS